MRDTRAQSEVVGSLLLVAVIVLAISTVGGLLLLGIHVPDRATAEAHATANTSTLSLTHTGGDRVPFDDLVLVVETGSERYAGAFEATYADGTSETFGPGERWERTFDSLGLSVERGDRLDVRLLYEPSGDALFRGSVIAE